MTYTSLLISTATVRRYTSAADDIMGNPVEDWADHLTDQACRLSYVKGKQIMWKSEITPVDAMLFMQDIDVNVYDRVIVDGTTTWEIMFVADRQNGTADHHKELYLKRNIP